MNRKRNARNYFQPLDEKKTTPIQLWQLHHADANNEESLKRAMEALKVLVEKGVVKQVGLCNATVAQIQLCREIVPIVSVQNHWSLWDRVYERPLKPNASKSNKGGVLPYSKEHGITFIPYGCMGGTQARSGKR